MQSTKKAPAEYGGKDALATLIAECGGETEASAKQHVEKVLTSGRPRKSRRMFDEAILRLGKLLADVPPHERRGVVVVMAHHLMEHWAESDIRWKYPVLRNSKMITIASRLFARQTVEDWFVQGAFDYIVEYRSALEQGRPWKAAGLKLWHWFGFAKTVVIGLSLALGRALEWADKPWKWVERIWKVVVLINKGWP